jgi:hypothetical protein
MCIEAIQRLADKEIFIQLVPHDNPLWWRSALSINGRDTSTRVFTECPKPYTQDVVEDTIDLDASPEVEAALLYIAINTALDQRDFEEVKRLRDQIRPLAICCP